MKIWFEFFSLSRYYTNVMRIKKLIISKYNPNSPDSYRGEEVSTEQAQLGAAVELKASIIVSGF